MSKIKILIADDIPDIRKYFEMILSKEPDMQVVGIASSGLEAVQKTKELNPDVILMDIQMESRTAGIDATKTIKSFKPNIRVIILTIHQEDELLFQAYCAGVMDYIVKTDSIAQMLNSIRNACANQFMLRPYIAEKIVDELTRLKTQQESFIYTVNIMLKLTNSEFEILKCFFEGNTYKQICESRFVSQATVKSQVNSILKKFEMKNMKDVLKLLHLINFNEIIKEHYYIS
ncbi:MAG: response regulator [Acetanaerobacterium sp.]